MCASMGWISAKALSSALSSLWADLAPWLAEGKDDRFADTAYIPAAASPITKSTLGVLTSPSCKLRSEKGPARAQRDSRSPAAPTLVAHAARQYGGARISATKM